MFSHCNPVSPTLLLRLRAWRRSSRGWWWRHPSTWSKSLTPRASGRLGSSDVAALLHDCTWIPPCTLASMPPQICNTHAAFVARHGGRAGCRAPRRRRRVWHGCLCLLCYTGASVCSRGEFRAPVVHFGSPQLLPGTGCAALRPGFAALTGPTSRLWPFSLLVACCDRAAARPGTLRASNCASGALSTASLPSRTPESSRRCACLRFEKL